MDIELCATVDVSINFYAGEKETLSSPGEPASVEIETVELNGNDITHFLTSTQLDNIAEEALTEYMAQKEDEKYEYAIQKVEDRLYK